MDETTAANLGNIIGRIRAFDRRCAENEYTDTGEVWDLLHDIDKLATTALAAMPRTGTGEQS